MSAVANGGQPDLRWLMQVILAYCNCENECREMMYGKGMRDHILMNGGKLHETKSCFEGQCTVCGTEWRRLD